jgi:exodeoxyribonuclease VII small subunit
MTPTIDREVAMTQSDAPQDGERFEDQLERLEEIVANLEDETVGLEEALELFEDGMKLAKSCRARLEEVEQRVQQLLEAEDADTALTAPLDGDGSDAEEPDGP